MDVGWPWLALGAALASLFTMAPWLRLMGWLLGSLFHETGHVAFSWYAGAAAWPVISLRGHAAAFHRPQSVTILVLVAAILVTGVVLAWRTKRFFGLAIGLLAAWPLFAFLPTARQLGFLLSGHLGELVFAGVFLARARTGDAVEHESERPLYACLGWFLVARNVALAGGLAFTSSARAWYMQSGSFGLTNDYARVAHDVLGVPLESVAGFMLLVSLSVFPLVLALTWDPPGRVLLRTASAVPPAPPRELPDVPPAAAPAAPPRRVLRRPTSSATSSAAPPSADAV